VENKCPKSLGDSKTINGKISARKCPIGSTNNQWDKEPPLVEVSLYPAQTHRKIKEAKVKDRCSNALKSLKA
jgi:hypothetical protein